MFKVKIFTAVIFIFFLNINVFAVPRPSPKKNESIQGNANSNLYRIPGRVMRSIKIHGFGIIAGIGAFTGNGEINYEELQGKSSVDTGKADETYHATTFSAGLHYEYSHLIPFLGVLGFKFDVLYQRFAMEIDNRWAYSGGVVSVGGNHNLYVDYVVFNPAFKFVLFSVGCYFGILTRASIEDLKVTDKFKNFDFGITFALDLTLPLKNRNSAITFVFEGVFGLLNILKSSKYNVKNIGFFFKVGYLFNIF